jgi:hypothetical protein
MFDMGIGAGRATPLALVCTRAQLTGGQHQRDAESFLSEGLTTPLEMTGGERVDLMLEAQIGGASHFVSPRSAD